MRSVVLALVIVGAAAGTAAAYPQFELSRDVDCTSCHTSPAGGGLLNENGLSVAETVSQFGQAPELMYGKIEPPSWLLLGGDVRAAAGYIKTPEPALAAFPMQVELYGEAKLPGGFVLHANFGPRPATEGNEAATAVWSREHYLMWRSKPDETGGVFVRVGRFNPVIGLRLAEHPAYVRRYGGTQLYSETYGVAAHYIGEDGLEAHASGFIEDPIIDAVEHSSGGAVYLEKRLGERMSFGVEGLFENAKDDRKTRGGITAKHYLPGPDLLLQMEVQYVFHKIEPTGIEHQIVGYAGVTRMLGDAIMLDVGVGHYDHDIKTPLLDRDCADVNLHWFTTSHVELVLNSRIELNGWNKGGDPGAYALLQAHYRL